MTNNSHILRRVDQRFNNKLRFFNSKVKTFLTRINSKVFFSNISIVHIDTDEINKIELFCCLKNLPDCGSRDKPLNEILTLPASRLNHSVYITAILNLDINSDELGINKYNTEVRYCQIAQPSKPNELHGIIGFHYDFDDKGQTNHPIFHAQQNNKCGNRIFSEPRFQDFISNHSCAPIEDGPSQLKYIRIPTPQMDIFSTVISIIADYVVHPTASQHKDLFKNLLRDVYPDIIPFNYQNLDHINDDFKNAKNCLNYWYPNFISGIGNSSRTH
ncbi:hypothetical protein D3C81_110880 [compost metagenome]